MRNYAKVGGRKGMPARLDSRRRLLVDPLRLDRIEASARRGYRTQASFRQKVLDVVRKIPKGKTLTYKEVAVSVGNPKAYRAVGNILNKNYDPKIPCHRVIRSDGKIGGYNRGTAKKEEILAAEKKF